MEEWWCFTTPQLGEKSSFNPCMARLLQVKTPLLNSNKTPLLISQILTKYHPEIIQKSSRNQQEIIQISSRCHLGEKSSFNPCMARLLPVKTPLLNSIKTPLLIIQILPRYHPEIILVKSRVLILVWHDYSRLKLHF